MDLSATYIPIDRRWALAHSRELPDRTSGAVLFADISGFTPLTAALLKELGLKRGPEEVTRQLNLVYEVLIAEVHHYGGSVIGFSGDAVTCWFDSDDGRRATACALEMQQRMVQFKAIGTPAGTTVSLGMKAAVAAGPVRRFVAGDPNIQRLDILAGAPLERMAAAEQLAARGEVVVAPEIVSLLKDSLKVAEYREDDETGLRFALISGLNRKVPSAPWPANGPALTDEQIRPWLLPPVYERLKGGQGQFLAETRPAVALFMRFSGFDYDGDDLVGPKLDFLVSWVQGVLVKYQGFLMQLTIGDKGSYLYAVFGAPLTYGDDSVRAVAAALDLQTLPDELSFVGPVQIGISQGRMRTGAYGGTARQTYGVLGDEVNMAARLMSQARPGQIIVSQRIAESTAGHYLLQNLGPIEVKGKVEPILVVLVLGRQRHFARQPINVFPDPLVGRDDELARLGQLLKTAAASEGQLLRVQGEAGIGKSHLTAAFAEQALAQGWRVVLGSAQSVSKNIPYQAWRQIFRALFILLDELFVGEDPGSAVNQQIEQVSDIVAGMNADWLVRLPLLGELLNLPIPDNTITATFEPQLRQEALLTLAVDLLKQWAQAQPLLILLEDAHWLDETSQGLILTLARVIRQIPAMLVLIERPPLDDDQSTILPELDPLPNYHRLDLGELSPEGVRAVVAHRLRGNPTPLLLELIQLQARGNPFFVEELVDTLRELGHLNQQEDGTWNLAERVITALRQAYCLKPGQAGQWMFDPDMPLPAAGLGLPDSIHGLVLARLDRLPETHKLTLKVASVIGRFFDFQLLTYSHPAERNEGALLAQVKEFEQRDFTRLETPPPQLAYIFKHNITRDVVYDSLLEQQQQELHRGVAEATERIWPSAVEQLAYHYSRARVHPKALVYLDRAAHKAQREYANETALSYFSQALALEERWRWRKGQIEVLHVLGHRQEELAALEQLQRLKDVPEFEVAYLWGQYYEAIADYPAARSAVEHTLAAAHRNQDYLGEIRSLGQLGLITRRQGDYQTAKSWYEQALARFDAHKRYPLEETTAFAHVLNGLGIVSRQQGDFDQARQYYQQALDLSRSSNNQQREAEALNHLGVTAFYQRHFTEALEYHRQALHIRQAIGDRTGEGTSLFNLALATRDAGDYGLAQDYLLEALTIHQITGNRWEEVNAWNDLGVLYLLVGDLPQAQSCFQQGLASSQEIGDEAGQAYILCNIGQLKRDGGDLAAANQFLIDSLALAQAQADTYLNSMCLSHLATVRLQAGEFSQAIELAGAALSMRLEGDLFLLTSIDLTTLARTYLEIGDIDKAVHYAGQALDILDGCGGIGPEFPHHDYFFCYQVMSAAGHRKIAGVALTSAHELLMSQASKITDPLMRQSFLEKVAVHREIVAAYRAQPYKP